VGPAEDTLPAMAPKMHAGEVRTDPGLVRRMLVRQFPGWADLPITPVRSFGTDHDIYRLGEHLSARLPRIGWAQRQAAKEAEWLPRLGPLLPLAVPVPVGLGRPDEDYPFSWAVHRWLPGEDASGGPGDDPVRAAIDLAGFIRALRAVDVAGAPPRAAGSRGGPLSDREEGVRRAVAELGNRIDGPAVLRSWAASLAAPAWDRPDVWVHGDLLPGNLLLTDGRLSGVIDFGSLNAGDPACDLLPAWNVFSGAGRSAFLDALGTDGAAGLRGRGWALSQAVIALPYYWSTNPGIVAQARHALAEVLRES
jgi:aminoglycoside phosphotransferase (APT) family kinase protein